MGILRGLLLAAVIAVRPAATDAADLEVMHYWVAPSERAALDEIRAAFEARGGVWKDLAVEGSAALREEFAASTADGIPPGAIHWVPEPSSEQLVALQAIAPVPGEVSADWETIFSPYVQDGIRIGGEVYFIPVTVHVENWLWYNKTILDRHGLTIPRSWPEIVETAHKLKAAGEVPFAISTDSWTHDIVVRAVLAGVYAPLPDRDALLADWRAFVASPHMEEVVDILAGLGEVIEPTAEPHDWAAANREFMAGRAAIQIMGDWVKAEMAMAGLKIGKDVVCAVPPGNERSMAAVIDAFVLAADVDDDVRAAQELFARTVVDPSVQLAFSSRKGSTPVRIDVERAELDSCAAVVSRGLASPEVRKERFSVLIPAHGNARFYLTLARLLHGNAITRDEALARIRELLDDPDLVDPK